jgi:hypothetical protein
MWEQQLLPSIERRDQDLRQAMAEAASAADDSAACWRLVAAAERLLLALRRASALASHLSGGGGGRGNDDQPAAEAVLAATREWTARLLASDVLLAASEHALRVLQTQPDTLPSTDHRRHRAAQLVRRLRRDGWQPRRASEAAAALPAEDQRAMHRDLSSQARRCCSAAALELTSDALAPRVEADTDGAAEVLAPVGLWEERGAGGGSPLFMARGEQSELVLTLPATEAMLTRHPRADVREAVAAAGMAPRTDALLRAWQTAGDARRRLARARGEASHAAALARGVDGLLGAAAGPDGTTPRPPWGIELEEETGGSLPPAAAFLVALARRLQRLQQEEEQQAQSPLNLDDLFAATTDGGEPLLDRALCGVGDVARAAFGLELSLRRQRKGRRRGDDGDDDGNTGPLVYLLDVHDVATGNALGLIVVDPAGGYGTRQLLFAGEEEEEEGQGAAAPPPPPTAATGLQAGKLLLARSPSEMLAALPPGADPAQAVADALAELAHELGHALHFVLSSSAAGAAKAHAPFPTYPVAAAPMEQPLWLLELPSTLLELLCSDRRALERMLWPSGGDVRNAAAIAAASALAERQAKRRTPAALAGLVALMRADEAVSRWSGPRQTSLADAMRSWQEAASEWPGEEQLPLLTPDQARAAPRVLSAQGQGYGYVVAWCLASALVGEMVKGVEEEQERVATTVGGGGGRGALTWIRAAPGRAVRSHLLEAGAGLPAAVTARELVRAVLGRECEAGGGPTGVALSLGGGGGGAGDVRAAFSRSS